MNINWINPLLEDYYKWIKSQTFVLKDNQTGWATISTPFIGIFNDTIEIFVKKNNEKIILSDNCETINNLKLVGVEIKKGKRREIADSILLNYGVKFRGDELFLETKEDSFSQKKHNFLSAMLELNNIYMLSKNYKKNEFFEALKSKNADYILWSKRNKPENLAKIRA